MGTNYYLHLNKCDKCGRYDQLHIGKSSAGWRFLFQFIRGTAETVDDWKKLIEQGEIFDECDMRILSEDFWAKVKAKQEDRQSLPHETYNYRQVGEYAFSEGEWS